MKQALSLVLVAIFMTTLLSATDYVIGTGTSTEYYAPVNGSQNYGWSKFLYTNAELTSAGMTGTITISKIAFYVSNTVTGFVTDNQKVYIAYTYNSSYSGYISYPNPSGNSAYTLIYDGSVSWSGPGWMEISFINPFNFTNDGFAGLEIVWENRDGSGVTGYPKFCYTSKTNSVVYKYGTSFSTAAGSTYGNRPNIKFMEPSTTPPDPANAVSPANNTTGIDTYTNLTWAPGSGSPDSYLVSFGTDNPPSNLVSNQTTTSTNYDLPDHLSYLTTYYWQIIPHNANGYTPTEDCPIWSFTSRNDPTVTSFPYFNDFQNGIDAWTILNEDHDVNLWSLKYDPDPNYAMSVNSSNVAKNDWLITPPMQLTGGTSYEIKYNYRGYMSSLTEKLAVAVGSEPLASSMTTVIADHPGFNNINYSVGIGAFTPSTTGIYYFGFHAYSAANQGRPFVDNVRITTANNDYVSGTSATAGGSASFDPLPIYNYATNQPLDTSLTITGISGTPTITSAVLWSPPETTIPNAGLVFTLSSSSGSLAGATVTFTHNLGFIPSQIAYRIIPGNYQITTDPNNGTWTTTQYTITIPINKATGDFEVVFPAEENQTLPVELSSFTATLTSDMFVNIAWITQSETNLSGYNILRNTSNNLSNALNLSDCLIHDGVQTGSQVIYSYLDTEVDAGTTYYYWLESVDLDGTNQFYGPMTVMVMSSPDDPGTPNIPTSNALLDAYPNPFNPSTNLRFAIKDAGTVRIDIYNARGQLIRSYENSYNIPGTYQIVWDGKDESGLNAGSGVYLYHMNIGNFSSTKKMVISK